jgi:hypothetical protein
LAHGRVAAGAAAALAREPAAAATLVELGAASALSAMVGGGGEGEGEGEAPAPPQWARLAALSGLSSLAAHPACLPRLVQAAVAQPVAMLLQAAWAAPCGTASTLAAALLTQLSAVRHLTPPSHAVRRLEAMGAAAAALVSLLASGRRLQGQRQGGEVRLAALLQLLLLDMNALGGGEGAAERQRDGRPAHATLVEGVVTLLQLDEGAELHQHTAGVVSDAVAALSAVTLSHVAAGGALTSLARRLGTRAVAALALHVAALAAAGGHGSGVSDAAVQLAAVVAGGGGAGSLLEADPLEKWLGRLLPALLELVDVGSERGQEEAMGALKALADSSDLLCVALIRMDALPALLRMLRPLQPARDSNGRTGRLAYAPIVHEEAAGVLRRLLLTARRVEAKVALSPAVLTDILALLRTPRDEASVGVRQAAAALLEAALHWPENRAVVLSSPGAVELLVALVTPHAPHEVFQSVAAVLLLLMGAEWAEGAEEAEGAERAAAPSGVARRRMFGMLVIGQGGQGGAEGGQGGAEGRGDTGWQLAVRMTRKMLRWLHAGGSDVDVEPAGVAALVAGLVHDTSGTYGDTHATATAEFGPLRESRWDWQPLLRLVHHGGGGALAGTSVAVALCCLRTHSLARMMLHARPELLLRALVGFPARQAEALAAFLLATAAKVEQTRHWATGLPEGGGPGTLCSAVDAVCAEGRLAEEGVAATLAPLLPALAAAVMRTLAALAGERAGWC